MNTENTTNSKIYTVSELNQRIKNNLEDSFQNIWIEGEVSNFYFHNKKHMYFDLKDENSKVKIVMFYQNNHKLIFDMEEGLHIIVNGYISVYEKRGEYQLIASDARPVGKGSLILAFEQLKEKLLKKGYFDIEKKKKIPLLPRKIGIATSRGGAVLRDIVSVLRSRSDNFHLIVRNVNVGGTTSAGDICEAIEDLCEYGVDVIIIARGGGSLEDLWAFNSEELASKIYDCQIPLISAVGHQTDYTISDFVADLRAATPSVAAENVILDKKKIILDLNRIRSSIEERLDARIRSRKEQIGFLINRKFFREPLAILNKAYQDIGELSLDITDRISSVSRSKRLVYRHHASRLDPIKIGGRIKSHRLLLRNTGMRWNNSFFKHKDNKKNKLESSLVNLEKSNPIVILRKGFSVINDENTGKAVKSIMDTGIGKLIRLLLKDGTLKAKVLEVDHKKPEIGKKSENR
ncbi:exodeoxyribonuclease VII large subunit [Actinomycetota bacterium]